MARVKAGESGGEFRLVWQEDGGPAVDRPAVAGFGTSMLSQPIEYQHEGKSSWTGVLRAWSAVSLCRLPGRRVLQRRSQ
jgi:hypothetical protein